MRLSGNYPLTIRFMTIFAYRFPLDLVFRILDIIFAEGAESVLRFSLALISRNAEKIVTLDFESLVGFLKVGLFDVYADEPTRLVIDASAIKLSKAKLDAWSVEFHTKLRLESPDFVDAENLRSHNRRIMGNIIANK